MLLNSEVRILNSTVSTHTHIVIRGVKSDDDLGERRNKVQSNISLAPVFQVVHIILIICGACNRTLEAPHEDNIVWDASVGCNLLLGKHRPNLKESMCKFVFSQLPTNIYILFVFDS